MKRVPVRTVLPLCLAAAGVNAQSQDSAFTLGQITVTAPRIQTGVLADPVVDSEEIWVFNVNTLDEAIKLVPGVSSTFDSNGRRNEHDIFVRGFGRWQVPLSIDGIRIYLPADNRLDFNRFLTDDLAQIQIQKGYASIIDGPGGLGGAINLVTRRPTREFEADFRSGISLDGDGSYEGWTGAANIGTRQERYYLQAGGSYLDRDRFTLSDDFRPTAIEDGGERNRSDNRDWRVNAKMGFTPNDTDEYSLSYISQSGAKGAPLHVFNNPPNPPNSYWDWPWWDIENLYWLSNTQLGDSSYLKTRLFYNTFYNGLYSYDNATYTTQSNGRFRSIYEDEGYGGSIEVGGSLTARNVMRAAVHYRRDEHTEYNINNPTSPTASVEPLQTTLQNGWSVALENTFQPTTRVDVIVGVSYDKNDVRKAQEFNGTSLFEFPTVDNDAVNGQGAVHWRYAEDAELHASVSSRTRFPTIFERYSSRLGSAIPNPDLTRERGINYEIGWRGQWASGISLTTAVFYNDVKDAIEAVIVTPTPRVTQTRNVGDGEYYGLELALDSRLGDRLRFGANYTYLERDFVLGDPLQPSFRLTGTPNHQAFLFLSYQPIEALTLTPSLEYADDRWSDGAGGSYVKVGEYALTNLQVQYRIGSFDLTVGGRNLTDRNFQLAYGYPEPGRTWFAKFRFSY